MILSKDSNNNWAPTAGGTGTFIGTAAAFNAVKATLPVNTVAYITDDGNGDLQPVDAVTNGDMRPVTSNAVYDKFASIAAVDAITNNDLHPVTSNAVYDKLNVVGDFIHCSLPSFNLSGDSKVVMSNVNLQSGTYLLIGCFMNCSATNEIKIVVNGIGATVNSGIIRANSSDRVDSSYEVTAIAKFVSNTNTVGISFDGNTSGGGNGDGRFWYVNAIRIG